MLWSQRHWDGPQVWGTDTERQCCCRRHRTVPTRAWHGCGIPSVIFSFPPRQTLSPFLSPKYWCIFMRVPTVWRDNEGLHESCLWAGLCSTLPMSPAAGISSPGSTRSLDRPALPSIPPKLLFSMEGRDLHKT